MNIAGFYSPQLFNYGGGSYGAPSYGGGSYANPYSNYFQSPGIGISSPPNDQFGLANTRLTQPFPSQFAFPQYGNASPYLPNFYGSDWFTGATLSQPGSRPGGFLPPQNSIGTTVNIASGQVFNGSEKNETFNLGDYTSGARVEGGQGKDYFRISGRNNVIYDEGGADEVFFNTYASNNKVYFNGNNGPDVAVVHGRESEYNQFAIDGGVRLINKVSGAVNEIFSNNLKFLDIFFEIPEGEPDKPVQVAQAKPAPYTPYSNNNYGNYGSYGLGNYGLGNYGSTGYGNSYGGLGLGSLLGNYNQPTSYGYQSGGLGNNFGGYDLSNFNFGAFGIYGGGAQMPFFS